MPIMSGWEVSPDRVEKYDKMMSTDDIGEPIITSKCKLRSNNGFLVASNNGFAWRIHGASGLAGIGMSKWVRWHDVGKIERKRVDLLLLYVKLRKKNGNLILDKKGNPKLIKWPLRLRQNKNEEYGEFLQRRSDFSYIMSDLFNQNKGDTYPPTSDSRY